MQMTLEQTEAMVAIMVYGYWGKHPGDFPVEDWQYEVANGDTRQGYWEWCAIKEIELENDLTQER